jgi:uncharacterized protein (TIGR02186 family)
MRNAVLLLSLLLPGHALAAIPSPAPLIVDLSSNRIDITTGFAGTNLLLFGAVDHGGDVVVVVRGPRRSEEVRRKERVAGIWINGKSVTFNSVPGYYFVASNRPLLDIASENTLRRLRIGPHRIGIEGGTPADRREFQDGLIDLKQRTGLYSKDVSPVRITGGRLFRADLTFPANVPTGAYTAEVYLFRQGVAVETSRTTLAVRKAGVEAQIYNFAHNHSALYGIVAILIALFAGWFAGAVFRKV